jgi:hypothetical protein
LINLLGPVVDGASGEEIITDGHSAATPGKFLARRVDIRVPPFDHWMRGSERDPRRW